MVWGTIILLFTQTHKEKHHINKIKIFNIMIQNKLQGAKAQKQGKQETPHRTPLVTHILDRPIRSRAEAPASNTSQHAQRCPMHQIVALTQTYTDYTTLTYELTRCIYVCIHPSASRSFRPRVSTSSVLAGVTEA
jgi:hypothetical protein